MLEEVAQFVSFLFQLQFAMQFYEINITISFNISIITSLKPYREFYQNILMDIE